MSRIVLFLLVSVVSVAAWAGQQTTYKLRFANQSNEPFMKLHLDTADGVETLEGINTASPITLAKGLEREIGFQVKGSATSWRLHFKICHQSTALRVEANQCDEAEPICSIEASGVGALPFYSSNTQDNHFKCSPDMLVNRQEVDFTIQS